MPLLSPQDIINAACARIGEDPLGSLDDEGGGAAGLLYEEVVGFNLGLYQFSFGRELAQLAVVTGASSLAGYENVLDLPTERVGPPLYLTDDPSDPDARFSRYALIGGTVHADADPLFAMVKIIPPPARWSTTFKTCTITALASRLALSMASDRATSETLQQDAYGSVVENFRGGQMRAAISEDAQATPPRPAKWDRNPLTNAWRG